MSQSLISFGIVDLFKLLKLSKSYVDLHHMHEGTELVKLCQNIKGEMLLDHFDTVLFVVNCRQGHSQNLSQQMCFE